MPMLPPGIRAIVFDAVGTLIHPDPLASVVYAEVGRRFGSRYQPDEIAKRFTRAFRGQEERDRTMGWRTSEVRERERWRVIVGEVLDDVFDAEACFQELFAHFGQPSAWRCTEGADALLSRLATKYRLAIASNYDGRLRSVVAGRPELRPIQHVLISAELGWRKPAREFYSALCQALAITPSEVLYLGDELEHDYEAACAAGIHGILYDPTGRTSLQIKSISSLMELT